MHLEEPWAPLFAIFSCEYLPMDQFPTKNVEFGKYIGMRHMIPDF